MAWVKLSDDFYERPGLQRVGPEARLLYTVGETYIAKNLTDGYIGGEAVPTLALRTGLGKAKVRRVAEELVKAGQWEPRGSGWYDPDYLLHNRSAEKVLADREENREKQARYRGKTSEKSSVSGEFPDSSGKDDQEGEAENNSVTNRPQYQSPSSTRTSTRPFSRPSDRITADAADGDGSNTGLDSPGSSRGREQGQDAPTGGAADVAPETQATSTDSPMSSSVLADSKMDSDQYRPTLGEPENKYRARLRWAYTDASPDSPERAEIAYALASYIVGRSNLKRADVAALEAQAVDIFAFDRALTTAATRPGVKVPLRYAVRCLENDNRPRDRLSFEDMHRHFSGDDRATDAMYADFGNGGSKEPEESGDLATRWAHYNSLPKWMDPFRRRMAAGISHAEADPGFDMDSDAKPSPRPVKPSSTTVDLAEYDLRDGEATPAYRARLLAAYDVAPLAGPSRGAIAYSWATHVWGAEVTDGRRQQTAELLFHAAGRDCAAFIDAVSESAGHPDPMNYARELLRKRAVA